MLLRTFPSLLDIAFFSKKVLLLYPFLFICGYSALTLEIGVCNPLNSALLCFSSVVCIVNNRVIYLLLSNMKQGNIVGFSIARWCFVN